MTAADVTVAFVSGVTVTTAQRDRLVFKPGCWPRGDYFRSPRLMTNQPTNHQLWFESDYLSVRLTMEHEQLDEIKNLFDDYNWCVYMHSPKDGKEHFHLCIPEGKPEAIRQRIKRAWSNLGHLGNKFFSVKQYRNGLRGFVFYCHHEGADPVFKFSEVWEPIVNDVVAKGAYKKHDSSGKSGTVQKVRERLSNPQLTTANLLRQAVKYASENNTGDLDLGSVLKRMVLDGGWDPSRELMLKKVPSYMYDIFAFRIGKKNREEVNLDWTDPHKDPERLGDVPTVDTDYQFTKRQKKRHGENVIYAVGI